MFEKLISRLISFPKVLINPSVKAINKRDHILDSAEMLFGSLGFEAVSTRHLAREAGVNMAMLSYYFGSKEKLFEQMIYRRTAESRVKVQSIVASERTPDVKLIELTELYVDKILAL